ncbi:hypothetical protein AB0910_27900 [Streptomyces sp. NPDC047002]|uniref:hypothetical protein n=1 Tax=Streptomyces sp. NPDC047002 TaxID=3155475 RepID=UPI00345269A7
MTLRSLLSLPRMLRHGSTVGTDLPPDTSVVLDPPEPRLRPALVAAARGDHGPARALLAATRLGGEWENRGAWLPRLASAVLHNPGALDAWFEREPDDPDAALLRAAVSLKHAWAVRTGARAKDVPQEQFQAFFALLDDAVPVISAAAEANPADPVPWQLALEHATGSQSPREVFDAYWAEAVARAPHHYGCHVAALQYLCEKWHGSHEEMFDFAERAAQNALPGSKLHALPLLAAVEYDVLADAPGDGARSRISRVRVRAAVDRALALAGAYEPGDPEVADVRNHLALMLLLGRRPEESLAQFSALGTHATEYPWAYFGPPREQFLEFRAGVRLQVAARIPFFTGRRAVPAQRARTAEAVTVAVLRAAPRRVAEAARQAGADLRIAPRGDATYAEVPAGLPQRGASARRATLMGEDGLTAVTASLTRAVRRPALVLRRTGDRYGFTLLQRGRRLADHVWDPAAPLPDHETAAATARALAASYGIADARPLTALLRASNAPAARLSSLVAALGLPPVPPELTLARLPDTQLITRRTRRPRGWWAARIAAVAVCAPATVYAWWAPGVGRTRASLATVATAYLTARLTRAWRHRPRPLTEARS